MDTKNKTMKYLSIFFILIALFSSCLMDTYTENNYVSRVQSSPTTALDRVIENTFIVTLATGETKTFVLHDTADMLVSRYWVGFNYRDYDIVSLDGIVDYGNCHFSCTINHPLEIGNEYVSTRSTTLYIDFEVWSAVCNEYGGNSVKSTLIYTAFNYPGRITGIVKNYDKDDNILVTGIFNFVSI